MGNLNTVRLNQRRFAPTPARITGIRCPLHRNTHFIRSGGSIPIVGDFDRHLGAPSVMMGFSLPDDNIHAPNEKFHLKNFELGIESLIRFLEEAGG